MDVHDELKDEGEEAYSVQSAIMLLARPYDGTTIALSISRVSQLTSLTFFCELQSRRRG